jgi:hypothetical protein
MCSNLKENSGAKGLNTCHCMFTDFILCIDPGLTPSIILARCKKYRYLFEHEIAFSVFWPLFLISTGAITALISVLPVCGIFIAGARIC